MGKLMDNVEYQQYMQKTIYNSITQVLKAVAQPCLQVV